MEVMIDGYIVKAPSRRINKKYDVYKNNKYLFSYGDLRYEHYKDRIGYYSDLDHMDTKRRKLYRIRHQHDHIDNPNFPGYWSYHLLW